MGEIVQWVLIFLQWNLQRLLVHPGEGVQQRYHLLLAPVLPTRLPPPQNGDT
jgi:hypothetical protein